MQVISFRPEHILGMELRPFDRLGLSHLSKNEILALLDIYAQAGPAYSVLHKGRMVCAGGVAVQPGRTADVWMLTTYKVKEIAVPLARHVRRILADAEKDFHINRLQTTVHEKHELPENWLLFLGFQCEGLLRKLAGDDNYYIYARIR